jgi:hypothetical protein
MTPVTASYQFKRLHPHSAADDQVQVLSSRLCRQIPGYIAHIHEMVALWPVFVEEADAWWFVRTQSCPSRENHCFALTPFRLFLHHLLRQLAWDTRSGSILCCAYMQMFMPYQL